MKKSYIFLLLLNGVFALSACSNDDIALGGARMEVRLTDAPGDYEEVNVEIKSVQVHKSEDAKEEGWVTLDQVNPGIYNLLNFANGRDTLLASAELPIGRIAQMRLILGDKNTLKLKNGTVVALKTPSGQTSGVKVPLNVNMMDQTVNRVLLDFDAAKSVVDKGEKGYILKPVIRTITSAVAGGIKGKVMPAAYNPTIYLISSEKDTIGGFATANGDFFIRGAKAGTYTVKFYTKDDAHNLTVEKVAITQGQIKNMKTIELK
ncbi:DUF4382 domain-containing protein [Pontibacter rugosus]|uniref:DUF4382 domain-containing protein n=1 Tax=Pontibacter rugosus TaxID=1745966 RepID=A0ABW3SNF5_9BACT